METYYPYKTSDGYCSVLEACDFEDAKRHLEYFYGRDVVFCEVEIDPVKELDMHNKDKNKHIERLLAENENYTP